MRKPQGAEHAVKRPRKLLLDFSDELSINWFASAILRMYFKASCCGRLGRIRGSQGMEGAKHAQAARRRACGETPKKTATGLFLSLGNQRFPQ